MFRILYFSFFISFSLFSQMLSVREIAFLPTQVLETSGIFACDNQSIWTHNDSGGANELYQVDSNGVILRTFFVRGASNVDWEDVTTDTEGNVYIADMGNNANNRTNLRIFRIESPCFTLQDTLDADTISFSYSDQIAFPPADSLKNFDAEALIWHSDSLFIFSKNYTNPFDGYTKMYALPAVSGNHSAILRDSFYTGPAPAYTSFVTSATLNASEDTLFLLGSDKLWLLHNFTTTNFLQGQSEIWQLAHFSQKEAICVSPNQKIWITDEQAFGAGGRWYELSFPLASGLEHVALDFRWKQEGRNLILHLLQAQNLQISTLEGKKIYESSLLEGENRLPLEFAAGIYLLQVGNKSLKISLY